MEVEAWPDEARILSLIGAGFSYDDAYHMAPRDMRRYLAIHNAWSIPSKERDDGIRLGGVDDAARDFASM